MRLLHARLLHTAQEILPVAGLLPQDARLSLEGARTAPRMTRPGRSYSVANFHLEISTTYGNVQLFTSGHITRQRDQATVGVADHSIPAFQDGAWVKRR